MAWTTPKTDWKVTIFNGVYIGDYFGYPDYNRIKGNIEYLAQMPEPSITISNMGADKTVTDMIYPDEFNRFERNLDTIATAVGLDYSAYPVFTANGNTPTFEDLNQIESFILYLYNVLSDSAVYAIDTNELYAQANGRRAKAE